MTLIILNDELNNHQLAEKSESFDLINEFDNNLDIIQLTNVYQLRVQKAQQLLEHLKVSIDTKTKERNNNEKMILNEENCFEIRSLQDKIGKFSDLLVTKSVFINPGQLISVSDILQETCVIVSKLESDRNNIQIEILKQKNKVDDLLSKIQSLSFIRMENLASAVQSEHEACSNDISELQWHIKHRSTVERKIREKRNKAADINVQLKEEIGEIKEYIPLVEEKLLLETDMLTKIEETKEVLLRESDASTERMEITMRKHADANKKAEAERQHTKRDLHNCNKTLSHTQKSLEHAIKEHKKMEDFKFRSEDKIAKNHQEIAKLNSENERKLMERSSYEESVDRLEAKLKEVLFDKHRLTNSRDKKQNDLQIQEEEQEIIIQSTTAKRNDLDQDMTTLRRNNNQMEIEIDSIKESREKCINDTEKTREKILSTKVDIAEAEKSFDTGIEEFTIEAKKHAAVKQRLADITKEAQVIEDKLRHSLADIENQIKQEIMTKTMVKSKMTTDAADLEISKKESLEKQKQMKKVLKEALALLNDMRLKVVEITSQHKKSNEELQRLLSENTQIIAKQEAMRSEKLSHINELTPTYDDLKSRIDVLTQKEEHVQWQIRTMNSQLLEMSASEKLITNAKKKIQETLLGTERENNALSLELEMNRKYQDRLTTAISQTVSQSNRMRNTHMQYLQERHDALAMAQREFDQSLATNGNLAKQYRSLQTDFYGMQDSYLDVIQEHLRGEETVKDMKEIQRLQKHMHNCTEAFFTMKLLYDEDQFRYLKRECGHNINKIELLKSKYTERIESMKTFLIETFPRESQLINVAE